MVGLLILFTGVIGCGLCLAIAPISIIDDHKAGCTSFGGLLGHLTLFVIMGFASYCFASAFGAELARFLLS